MRFAGLDIETTGLDPHRGHRLIQIGIAFGKTDVICHDVFPGGYIAYDPEAMQVNKFTAEMITAAKHAFAIDEIIDAELFRRGVPQGSLTAVGWNVGSFDLNFVRIELPKTSRYFSHRCLDLTAIAIFLSGGQDNWRDLKAAEHKKIEQELGVAKWHDAGYDALAALLQWNRWQQWYSGRRGLNG